MNTNFFRRTQRLRSRSLALAALGSFAALGALAANPVSQEPTTSNATSLEETRVKMGKWIEAQQLIAKERKDWQQGKEVLLARLELVKQETTSLQEKIAESHARLDELHLKRDVLLDQNDKLRAAASELADSAGPMETDAQRLCASAPQPIREKLQPLAQRLPADPTKSKATVAERFQNVLGILNELNKANNELTVAYEVHELADGTRAEVQAIYVGLAQAYFVSAGGEAGIGRPSADGWKWEPTQTVANDLLTAIEILQGKHTPAFIQLPAKLQ